MKQITQFSLKGESPTLIFSAAYNNSAQLTLKQRETKNMKIVIT